MLIQLKRNSGLAAALSAACRQPPPPPPPCSALLPECRFLHCQCHSHHQPLTYTRNSSIDLLKLEGAAIKHNNRKEMLRIENRSDQKQRTCSAAAALLRRRRQRVASSYIVCRGKSSLTSICSKHGLLLHTSEHQWASATVVAAARHRRRRCRSAIRLRRISPMVKKCLRGLL